MTAEETARSSHGAGTELAIQLEAARALQKQLQAALPDGKRPKPPPKDEGAYL
jgi:hypothetical protein